MSYVTKRSGKWQATLRGPDGKERTKTFRIKADAERWLDTQGADIARGQWVDPSAGKVTFRAYAEQWRSVQVHRPSSAATVETYLRRHVYPRIGDRPIGGILRLDVQSLVSVLNQGLAPATVEVIYVWVSSIFKSAAADRIIGVSPCRGIKTPTVARTKVEPLAAEKVAQLVQAVPERYRALIVLGAGTGVRISEALGLTVDRTDLMRKKVTIDRQLVGSRGVRPCAARSRIATTRPERFRSRRRSLSHWRSTFGSMAHELRPNLVIWFSLMRTEALSITGVARTRGEPQLTLWGCPRAPVTTRFATTTPARSYGQGRA